MIYNILSRVRAFTYKRKSCARGEILGNVTKCRGVGYVIAITRVDVRRRRTDRMIYEIERVYTSICRVASRYVARGLA